MVIAPAVVGTGYRLAGADVYDAATPGEAAAYLKSWLADEREGLVAVDERLLIAIDPTLIQDIESYGLMPLLGVPSGEPLPASMGARTRIADLIREAVGYHMTFAGADR